MAGRLIWFGALLLCTIGIAIFVWWPFNSSGQDSMKNTVTDRTPALLCQSLDQATLDDLIAGKMRMAVLVKSYDPNGRTAGDFQVSVGGADPQSRRVVSYFGLFPGGKFEAKSEKEVQKFLVPLSKLAREELQHVEICVEIAFAEQVEAASEARAEVALEFSERQD